MRRGPLVLLLAAMAAACGRGTPDAVVLISIDTLRADRLPAYGHAAGSTPAIDALRREALLFSDATTTCPLTLPAHATLFTGKIPPRHGVRDNAGYALSDEAGETLAQRLSRRGFSTAGFVSAGVLHGSTGISRGFEVWDDAIEKRPDRAASSEVQRPGAETVARALGWLDRRPAGKPVVLFVHLYEPHSPYTPPEPFASRAASPYDGEIAVADAAVSTLVEGLRRRDLYEGAEILLFSDHGEGLSDHGEEEHGILLYREALHVPLIWKRAGGRDAGGTIAAPASLADIVPTLLAIAGAPGVEDSDGLDLFGTGAPTRPRRLYAETFYPRLHLGWSDLSSSWDGRWHFIDGPRPELYDVSADPREMRDLFASERGTAAEARRFLDRLRTPYAPPAAADPEQVARLAALGYLTGAAPATEGPLPNPRDALPDLARMRAAFRADAEGRRSEAAAALAEILSRTPGLFDARWKLASILAALGRDREAEEEIRRAIALAPGRAAEMADLLGRVLARQGKLDEAEAAGRVATTFPDRRVFGTVVLADVALRRGDPAAALAALGDSPGLEPPPRGWHLAKGEALARRERRAEAEKEFREEMRWHPASSEAWAGLAVLMALRGERVADVRALLEQMHAASPGSQTARLAQRTLARLGDAAGAAAWAKRAG